MKKKRRRTSVPGETPTIEEAEEEEEEEEGDDDTCDTETEQTPDDLLHSGSPEGVQVGGPWGGWVGGHEAGRKGLGGLREGLVAIGGG